MLKKIYDYFFMSGIGRCGKILMVSGILFSSLLFLCGFGVIPTTNEYLIAIFRGCFIGGMVQLHTGVILMAWDHSHT